MGDKTAIESEKTLIEPTDNDNKTVIETDKTIIENNVENNESLSLKTFRDYSIEKEFEAIGAESDNFLIVKNNKKDFLKLYRKGVKFNEDILDLIYEISKKYEYFNKIIEYGYDDNLDRYYEISEYIPYGSIKKLDFNNAKTFIKQINEALHILHENNIIHRDLKPSNILIKQENPLKIVLIDFGVSSLLDKEFTKKLTTIKGTYAYFSPEAVSGYIGKESDYFSLGMVLLSLLDKNPFNGLDNAVIINTLVTQNVPIPSTIDENYQILLKGLLTRDPKKRWGYKEINDWLMGKNSAVYFDEDVDNSKKYKFQGKYYSLKELTIAFLQEENFELAQKHIARGYIDKYLEKIEEYDLSIGMEEQNTPLEKLIYLVYSINKNLDLILYGKIIDKDYIFQLLLKRVANELNKVEAKIFNIISDENFSNIVSLYEKLTNKNSELKEFVKEIDFSNLKEFLDIENIILYQNREFIDLTLKYIDKNNQENIFKIVKASIKKDYVDIVKNFYKSSNKYDYEILDYLIKHNFNIDSSKLNSEILDEAIDNKNKKVIEFLLQKGIKPSNSFYLKMLFKWLADTNLLEKYLYIFSFEDLKNILTNKKITLKGHNGDINSVAISSDNRYIISGSDDYTVKIWDFETGECLNTLEGHNDIVNSVAISSDNRYIISGSWDDTVKIWDYETGKCLKTLKGHTYYVLSVAISSDNRYIISGNRDKTVKIWDFETGKCLNTLEGHNDIVNSVAISSDNRYIISGSRDKTVKIWDFETGKCLKTLKGHRDYVLSVAISSDNRYIISGSGDNTVKIWNFETGKCLKTLKGHTYYVLSVAISSDNRYIISGSGDNTVKIWDFETGKCLNTLEGHNDIVNSVAISSDNRYIISGSRDRTVKIWDLNNIMLKNIKILIIENLEKNIKLLQFNIAVKLIKENLISFDNVIINLIENKDFEYLDKLLKHIANKQVFEFLKKYPQYIPELHEYIDKSALPELLDIVLENNDTYNIEFLYQKGVLPENKQSLIKYLVNQNKFEEINKNFSQKEIIEFLKNNTQYIPELYEYIDKSELPELFDVALKNNDELSVEFLFEKNIIPNSKELLLNFLIQQNKFNKLKEYLPLIDYYTLKNYINNIEYNLKGRHRKNRSVTISNNNKYIVFGSDDNTIKIWKKYNSFIEKNIKLIKFDIAIKLIEENLISLDNIITNLIENKDFEYLDKLLKYISHNKIIEFLRKNTQYIPELYEYIDKSKLPELFDRVLENNEIKNIYFFLSKNILPKNNKKLLIKYLAEQNKFEEISKKFSKDEIFKFLKENTKYIEKLYKYVDKSKLSKLFDAVLIINETDNIEFLLKQEILPNNKKLLIKYLAERNKFEEINSKFSQKEIFEFLRKNTQYISELYEYLDRSILSELFDIVLKNNDKKNMEFFFKRNIFPTDKDLIFNYIIKQDKFENFEYINLLLKNSNRDYLLNNFGKLFVILSMALKYKSLETIELLLDILKENNIDTLKTILKKLDKKNDREIIKIFHKHNIKLSFFEKLF